MAVRMMNERVAVVDAAGSKLTLINSGADRLNLALWIEGPRGGKRKSNALVDAREVVQALQQLGLVDTGGNDDHDQEGNTATADGAGTGTAGRSAAHAAGGR